MPFYDYYYLFFEEYRVQMYDVRYMNSVGSISLLWSPNCEITGYKYGQDTKSPRIAMALNEYRFGDCRRNNLRWLF